jgi:acetyl esterase/lipase
MKTKRGCLVLAAAIVLITCVVVTQILVRYQSLDDNAEAIVLTPDIADVMYCTMDGVPQKLDVYYPLGRKSDMMPLLVYVHGGGWTGGDKRKGSEIVDIPAMTSRGYVVAAVNYRRAPEYKFPAPLNDVKCAVRFLRANASRYKIDPNRVGIWGGSAGGHLSALVGLTDPSAGFDVGEHIEQSSRVRAVADLFGPADLTADMSLLQKLLLYRAFDTIDSHAPILKQASPVTYISHNAPPFLILQGDQDDVVPAMQSELFYRQLMAAGVDATLVIVKNANHNFAPTGGAISPSRAELSTMLGDFFDRWVRSSP